MNEIKKTRVAIQGIATSFHEIAAHTHFGEAIETIECLSFYDLCESLQNEYCDYAVMAIENAIAGSILSNYFLLQKYQFSIIGEIYVPIQMHLMALPGVKLENITCIESHPMAIRQCADFLERLKNVEIRESSDTAISAKNVKDKELTTTAAIANEYAANKFGLQILEKRIETNKKNYTRFFILVKGKKLLKDSDKASLYFEVVNKVGSLADALIILKNSQINISKIQSTPIIGKPSEYFIHVDIEWKDKKNYDEALQKMELQLHNLTILGEYRRGKIIY